MRYDQTIIEDIDNNKRMVKYRYKNSNICYDDLSLEMNGKSMYLGCYLWDNTTKYRLNDKYLIIYNYQIDSSLSTINKELVTNAISFFDIENQVVINDTFKNVVNKFNELEDTNKLILHHNIIDKKIPAISLVHKYRTQDNISNINYDVLDNSKHIK